MKKNYTCPVVEVNAFDFEDVVMVSAVTYDLKKDVAGYDAALAKLKNAAAAENKIVVEW